jgi:glutamate decarboxylase
MTSLPITGSWRSQLEKPGFTLYDLADRLRLRGWQVPADPMPEHRSYVVVQQVLARLGLSRDLAGLQIDDLKLAVTYLQKHPSASSNTPHDAGGYHHN